jgi:hypothetical protein
MVAALPQMAVAQDDGVFFDPGGPSDKEYAVPHEQARGGGGDAPSTGDSGGAGGTDQGGGADAQGGDGDSQGGAGGAAGSDDSQDPPLFGAGVSRGRGADGQAGASSGSDSVVGVSSASTKTNFAAGLGWFALIAAAVALAGGGLAYLIRARARGQTS